MNRRHRRPLGFSLLEVLIVVAIIGILAAVILPSFEPTQHAQLNSLAETIAGDLAYVRSLAVANDDPYKITFDLTNNRYTLTHSGANATLNTLPVTPFRTSLDTATSQVVDIASLPHLGGTAKLLGVVAMGSPNTSVTNIEFGSLGQTTQTNPTMIWLAAGSGSVKRYLSITLNPVTGLATIGTMQGTAPTIPGGSSGS